MRSESSPFYWALKSAKIDEPHIRVLVSTLESVMREHLATKDDLILLRQDTQTDLKAECATLKSELKTEIAGLKSELKAEIAAVRTELKTDLLSLENRLTLRMGMMLSAAIGIGLAAARFMFA